MSSHDGYRVNTNTILENVHIDYYTEPVACPGIRKGGGARKFEIFIFFCFSIFQGGGPAQKIADKMIFLTEKVAKYR